jgi:hypothetical protein
MYTFQFQDGTWRIARGTNSPYEAPMRGEALALYDGVYVSRRDAERALTGLLPRLGKRVYGYG